MEGYAGTIDVEPGPRDITIKLREVRLDLSIEVVHKHRIGSCKGRLVATPGGLRYEASTKDDAFGVGLNELERFEVDYLQKNLRVKYGGQAVQLHRPGRQRRQAVCLPPGRGQGAAAAGQGREPRRMSSGRGPTGDQPIAAATSSACPSTFTLSHRCSTLPSSPIRYVVRTMPMYFRP